MNRDGKEPHSQKAEDAALRADGAAGEPISAVQGSIREVSIEDNAAVRHGKKKGLAEIKSRVPSYNQPKISGAPQSKRENQGDRYNSRCAYQAFAGILQVDASKEQ